MRRSLYLIGCFLLSGLSNAQSQQDLNKLEALNKQTQENTNAIKILQRIKISGYLQTQFQYGEEAAALKVGSPNEDPSSSFNRIGIRRGRVKFSYAEKNLQAVFQLDITDKKLGLKDAYLNIQDAWLGSQAALRAGVFDRPFGHEISYSSSRRESPERSTIFQTLFPDERDLGAMLSLQASKNSAWNFLVLRAGLFAGNGIQADSDSKKDFIGSLSAKKQLSKNLNLGIGTSYYNGKVYQGTEKVYKMQGDAFVLDNTASNKGSFAKREYVGFDMQVQLDSHLGSTQLRGEYLFGTQPGTGASSKSPNSSSLPNTDTYIRKFEGGYLLLAQSLGKSPLAAVVKYDWYNPNTKVVGNKIGLNHTGKADLTYQTLGLGMLWEISKELRLQAYYDLTTNEKSSALAGYEKDLKDNKFTLRLQLKF